jgi:uncharacterized protein
MPRIPLFPLHVVLFPGMPLPLRVFEPRYLEMLADAEEGFGVVLIREGPEVGGPAVPHPVGTLARVEQRLDQGAEVHLVARGTRRFRILATHGDKPYLTGDVEWLPDPVPSPAGATEGPLPAPETIVPALFEEYLHLLAALTDAELHERIDALMEGQRRASPWAVACAVGGTLLVPPEEKQPLLEAATAREALEREQHLLARETARLRILARSREARNN